MLLLGAGSCHTLLGCSLQCMRYLQGRCHRVTCIEAALTLQLTTVSMQHNGAYTAVVQLDCLMLSTGCGFAADHAGVTSSTLCVVMSSGLPGQYLHRCCTPLIKVKLLLSPTHTALGGLLVKTHSWQQQDTNAQHVMCGRMQRTTSQQTLLNCELQDMRGAASTVIRVYVIVGAC